MKTLLRFLIYEILGIALIVLLPRFQKATNALRTFPAHLDLPHQAIHSRTGKKAPTIVPNRCEYTCQHACAKDENCLAYTFDANDDSCKMWDHLEIEVVFQAKTKSAIRCTYGCCKLQLL